MQDNKSNKLFFPFCMNKLNVSFYRAVKKVETFSKALLTSEQTLHLCKLQNVCVTENLTLAQSKTRNGLKIQVSEVTATRALIKWSGIDPEDFFLFPTPRNQMTLTLKQNDRYSLQYII